MSQTTPIDPLSRPIAKIDQQATPPVNKAREFEKQLAEQEKQITGDKPLGFGFQQSTQQSSVINHVQPQQQQQFLAQQQQQQQQQSYLGSLLDAPRKLFFKTAGNQQQPQFEQKETQFCTPTREIAKIGLNVVQAGELTIKEAKTHCIQGTVMIEGCLILTNYQVVFLPEKITRQLRQDYYYLPLGLIQRIDRSVDKKQNDTSYIDISSRDGRFFRFRFDRNQCDESLNVCDCMMRNAFNMNKTTHFAFNHYRDNSTIEATYQGWKIYNIFREFERQQIFIQDDQSRQNGLFKFYKNDDLCQTYYNTIVVPCKADADCISKTGKFRSKERVPILSYAFVKETKTISLWRSSQCKVGIGSNRSTEDEYYLKYMSFQSLDEFDQSDDKEVRLRIYDARPHINALGNQVAGKGYENTMFYKRCSIDFLDIHNIHKVRDAHHKFQKACLSDNLQFVSQLEQAGWYDHIVAIIQGTIKIARTLVKENVNCLVHCSDGWDRTAQLISLVQMMIDPYFRTIEGAMVLIQKEWVFAGHQFAQRNGLGNKNHTDEQRSPIFLQFLDCIHQLMMLYPLSFEFNELFLLDLAYHHQTTLFGTFLCDSYLELQRMRVIDETISIWSWMLQHKQQYHNSLYNIKSIEQYIIPDTFTGRSIDVWKQCFLYYNPESNDSYEQHQFTNDNIQQLVTDIRNENTNLKQSSKDQEKLSIIQQQYIKELQNLIYESNNVELIQKLEAVNIN